MILVVTAGIFVVVASLWFFRNRATHPAGTQGHKAIAVLYFSNLSQDPSLNWLDSGLTDMLTTNLAQVKGLDVLSTERVMGAIQHASKDGKAMDPAQAQSIARDAGADAYITGALLKIGPTQLRLDVRAQDSASGKILYSDKLEGQDVQSIFGMVDRLTANIAGSFLPAADVPQKAPEIEQASTSNVEAYRHFQQGVEYYHRYLISDAIRELEEAVRLDPQFALAYLRLATAYYLQGDLQRATEVANKADQLQSHLPRYDQLELQEQKAARSGDDEAQVAALQAIVAEFPRSGSDRGLLGTKLMDIGKPDQALQTLREGLALDPKNEDLLNFESYGLARTGDFTGALAANDGYQSVRPGDPNPIDTHGDILFMSGRDEDALAQYRKVLDLKPDFDDYTEYYKLAAVYTDQKKPDLAAVALQQFAQKTTPLSRLYVPGFQAQFKQSDGDFEGALAGYRDAVQQLSRAKQPEAAAMLLQPFAALSVFMGENASAVAFVQEQKLGGDELLTLVALQTIGGNSSAAQHSLQKYGASHPWIAPRALEVDQALFDIFAAVQKGDGQTALTRASSIPAFNDAYAVFWRALAHLLTSDYSAAESEFRQELRRERSLANGYDIATRLPALGILAHYYLGQLYEKTGKRDQALNEYQEFLSHFEGTQSRLAQIADARAAVKRLMQ
jgi:eukaryotic-like serine/threonine-protein kinase